MSLLLDKSHSRNLHVAAWTNISGVVIDAVKKAQLARIKLDNYQRLRRCASVLQEIYQRFDIQQPYEAPIPSLLNILQLESPTLKGFLDTGCKDSDECDDSTREILLNAIRTVTARWTKDLSETLSGLLESADFDLHRSPHPLKLAVTFFCCNEHSSRDGPLSWTAILNHASQPWPSYSAEYLSCDDRTSNQIVRKEVMHLSESESCGAVRASQKLNIKFHKEASTCAATLVKLCGLDPRVATASEMQLRDARFCCVLCAVEAKDDSPAIDLVMDWIHAVSDTLMIFGIG